MPQVRFVQHTGRSKMENYPKQAWEVNVTECPRAWFIRQARSVSASGNLLGPLWGQHAHPPRCFSCWLLMAYCFSFSWELCQESPHPQSNSQPMTSWYQGTGTKDQPPRETSPETTSLFRSLPIRFPPSLTGSFLNKPQIPNPASGSNSREPAWRQPEPQDMLFFASMQHAGS